ncbi:MAG: MurT ligase domain-containing protein [Actinomycetota bacterium]
MLLLAGLVARAAGRLSRLLGRGGGTTLPGVILLRLRPNAIVEYSDRLTHGSVLISATNGKTTTTRLVVAAAESLGLRVVTNAEGSNLERGIAAAFLHGPRQAHIAILEVDEAALPAVARATRPHALVLMNLFRDQLDRYGELDTIVDMWRDLLADRSAVDGDCIVVINADDPNLGALGIDHQAAGGVVRWFGIDDTSRALPERAHAADATNCRRCGASISHDAVLVGHLGHWTCPNCGLTRPALDVAAASIEMRDFGQQVAMTMTGDAATVDSGELRGLHNTYNVAAAMATASALPHFDSATVADAVGRTGAAFGRGELIAAEGRWVDLLLAKNPTGVNQNIRTLLTETGDPLHLLVLLNDRTADGQDVSWIWDVDWEPLDGRLSRLTLSGDRSGDLALRFRYGGFDMADVHIEPDFVAAFNHALTATPDDAILHVLPTYTAMLDLRSELTRRGHVDAYWDEP